MGHSDGASIALIHAAENPAEHLLGIVNEAPHVFCEQLTTNSIQKVQQLYLSRNLRERLQKHHCANVDCAFRAWANVWLHTDFTAWNIEACFPGILVPQLIVQGNDYEYVNLAQVEAIVLQSGSSVETSFLDYYGHFPYRDQEIQTLESMSKFVRKLLV